MTIATRGKRAWDTSAYHRMTAARYDAGELVVDFEDGTRARVDARALLAPGEPDPDWAGMVVDSYEIVVPAAGDPVEIPWSRIRLLTDAAFDAHWAAMAAEEDRIIGERIGGFRRERGWSRAELARRADLAPERLSEIEDGRGRAGFSTLERILAPLGRGLDDLWVEPESTTVPATAGPIPTAG